MKKFILLLFFSSLFIKSCIFHTGDTSKSYREIIIRDNAEEIRNLLQFYIFFNNKMPINEIDSCQYFQKHENFSSISLKNTNCPVINKQSNGYETTLLQLNEEITEDNAKKYFKKRTIYYYIKQKNNKFITKIYWTYNDDFARKYDTFLGLFDYYKEIIYIEDEFDPNDQDTKNYMNDFKIRKERNE